jgi:hypothetical protein
MFKKFTLMVTVLALAALAFVIPAWPGTVPASVVPEGARWIAHLDMEKFVASKLYEYLVKDGKFEIKSRDIGRLLKIDVPRDITGVTLFGLGPGDKQIVFAVAGKFDKAGIISLVESEKDHQKTPYGAYTLYSGDSDEHGAFINDNLIVFSEGREAVEKVLDTAGGKAKNFAGTPLSASLKEVPSGAFLIAVLPDLSGLAKEIGPSKVLDKAQGLFILAQEKQDLIQIRLQVTADSAESAKNMADVIQGLIAMTKLGGDQDRTARFASLTEGIQVKLDGKTVRVDFERPAREIADLVSQGRGLGGLFN